MSLLRRGFTLIELLLVIAIIAILATIVFVALNPTRRFQQSRDARRATDIETILTAIHLYINDFSGTLPTGLSTGMAEAQLGTGSSSCGITTGGCNVSTNACLDLSTVLASYLKTMPIDPQGSSSQTGYSVAVNSSNIITIRACRTETATLSTSR